MNRAARLTVSFARILAVLSLLVSIDISAEVHSKVQAALNWQLPANPCKKPRGVRHLNKIEASGGYISHAPTGTTEESGGAPTVFDVDHYKIERYQRQKKRWETCVSAYKSNLLSEFEELKASAKYGLTKPQANMVLEKMAQIQAVVLSLDGTIAASSSASSNQSSEPEGKN